MEAAYRAGLGKHEELEARWWDVALDPRMASPDVLRLALTVGRFEQGKTKDASARARLGAREAELWARRTQLDPAVRALRPTTV